MLKNNDNILYQDKYYLVIKNNRRHFVVMRPKVRVIIHDIQQDKLLILQDEWSQTNYGFFLPEDILYQDVQENFHKINNEIIKDALVAAENICEKNGVTPKNLTLFSREFKESIHCDYYYFLVTDFQKIKIKTVDICNWLSVKKILDLIKENAFYNEEEMGILFTYFLQKNKIIYNKNNNLILAEKGDV